MDSDVTIVRIHLNEADHGRRHTLMQDLLALLHDQHRVRNVIVFRGIAGIDDRGEVRSADMLRLTVDLPIVVEFFGEPSLVEAVLTSLSELTGDHTVLTWSARRQPRGGGASV